jgi:hypothetical protein
MNPEQIAEWREKFESKYTSEELFFQCGEYSDRYIQHEWQGYLRRCTEQATEIAALKAQIAELSPLAKFGAMVMCDFSALTVTKINNHALSQDLIGNGSEVKPSIEATITKLLKD